MDPRLVGTSTAINGNDNENNEASESIVSIDVNVTDLACPVTMELFFNPVIAVPCGHGFEGSASSQLTGSACPCCRDDISMFVPALDKRELMDKVLDKQPELYAQVYFNLDDFAEVVRKGELNTPLGERYMKLLRNAANHLNDKSLFGSQKNKTAIEILASTDQGRELLRHDKKLQVLLTAESLQLDVNGRTVADYISNKREPNIEKSPSTASIAAGIGLFTSSVNPAREVAPVVPPRVTSTVTQSVVYGDEDTVLQMIRNDPYLVVQRLNARDYSGRTIEGATPFQAALITGDDVMAKKIMDEYVAANPENGRLILDAQFNELFPNGYAAHIRQQKDFAYDYGEGLLKRMVRVMGQVESENGIAAVVREFQADYAARAQAERIYNPYYLLKLFTKYREMNTEFGGEGMKNYQKRNMEIYWREVIGWAQRYMPTNYMQSFCTGLGDILEHHQPLQRTLHLSSYRNSNGIDIFPLDTDQNVRLGKHFAIKDKQAAVRLEQTSNPEKNFRTLCEVKEANMNLLQTANHSFTPRR